ncbi:hypothetical protein [Streptomyces tauricus]|uniref:hypothetical protein n=1 Tax=Streptomyces tauricus TaxID=68274 RepID=UPI003801905F
MTTDTDTPRPQYRDHRQLRLLILLLALLVGLLITGAAVYVARVHPAYAQPLGVGAAVMGALAATAGIPSGKDRRTVRQALHSAVPPSWKQSLSAAVGDRPMAGSCP